MISWEPFLARSFNAHVRAGTGVDGRDARCDGGGDGGKALPVQPPLSIPGQPRLRLQAPGAGSLRRGRAGAGFRCTGPGRAAGPITDWRAGVPASTKKITWPGSSGLVAAARSACPLIIPDALVSLVVKR